MRYSKHIAILAGVVFLAFCLAELSAGRAAPALGKGVEKVEDPHKDLMIVVEAFMVEVPLCELYELGVPAISEGSKSVSAEQILGCLKKPKTGAVTGGAKVAVGQGAKGRTETRTTQGYYVGSPKEQDLQFEDFGVSLAAQAAVVPSGRISVELEFKHRGLDEGEAKGEVWPIVTERNLSCMVSLEPGKPTLVGATQDEETAVFLLVTANMQK